MQLAVIEYARNVLNLKDADSLEFNEKAKVPLFVLEKQQFNKDGLGGTLRLGNTHVS